MSDKTHATRFGHCTGCTDPRSEGTHQMGTIEHPETPAPVNKEPSEEEIRPSAHVWTDEEIERIGKRISAEHEFYRDAIGVTNIIDIVRTTLRYARSHMGNAQGWISVDAATPEEPNDNEVRMAYLCATTDGIYPELLTRHGGGWIAHGMSVHARGITHWMPLPDPPSIPQGEEQYNEKPATP